MAQGVERYGDWPNLATLMFACARRWSGATLLRYHRDGAWQRMAWGEFARRAASVARRLRASGVAAGDRVLLVSESRPEVPILETALMAIRAIPVPAYPTNTPQDHAHLLHDSGARVAVTSTLALAARVGEGARMVAGLDRLYCMQPGPHPLFAELESDPAPPDDIIAEAETIAAGTLACLLYTSGTSGPPRGVMLPHRAILANCRGAFDLVSPLRIRPGDVYLSFLPLSHAYEHTVGQFFLMSHGAEIVYCRGVEHMAADMLEIRPTLITFVPRILEVIRARILTGLKRETPIRQRLFQMALDSGMRRVAGAPTVLDRLADPVLDRLVRSKVRARFGGRLRVAMSGGARLDPDVGRFFLALGIKLMQGYGQTEAGPVIAANPPDGIRIATVGVALPGVELRIGQDDEILVRGDLVMDGYWRQPEATAEAIRDGWLHTGDVGRVDAEGYVTITDRKKDILVLSGGENVSPARIEGALMSEPEISQAVVYGDGQPSLSALLVPADGGDARTVADAVLRVNAQLAVTERVRRHRLVPPFTIENGLLTPSQKIRRTLVLRMYQAEA